MARHPTRHARRGSCRHSSSAFRHSDCTGIILRSRCSPIRSRILYVFEWLGFQEVTLPIKRDNPIAYMQFTDPGLYIVLALVMLIGTILLSLAVERAGSACRLSRSSRTRRRRKRPASTRWPGRCARSCSAARLRRRRRLYAVVLLVVTPAVRVRHAGFRTGLDGRDVRWLGTVWGPVIGSVILIPLAETLNAEAGTRFPGIQGVIFGLAIVCVILLAPEGLFWKVRDLWPGVSCHNRHPSRWMHRRRQRSRNCPCRCGVIGRPRRRMSSSKSEQSVALVRRPQGGPERQLQAPAQRNSRHHRPQRRRQDHVVQSAERLPAARCRRSSARGPRTCSPASRTSFAKQV